MYVKKLHKFDIDCNILCNDFTNAYNQIEHDWNQDRMSYWRRIKVTHSDQESIDDPLIWSCTRNFPSESFNINNIIPLFKNTYTEEVAIIINEYFKTLGLRTTGIWYASLQPNAFIQPHIDPRPSIRYHIPIQSSTGVSMICNGYKYSMEELGTLYSMKINVPHGAENYSGQDRIFLSTDTTKI